jgi:DNA uptake protein ComE-like DNA-binding protein
LSDQRWSEPPGLATDGLSSARNYGKAARDIWRANTRRRYENFRFDPNTVSVDDLMRLGFSQRQAEAIDNYRKKGGRFRRKTDFARSYVVEDSVYKRLERFIDIPKIDINRADSAAFETLPGIGKFFAAKMVSYRKELGGYSFPEQLMDIWHFDQEKFDGLKDLITVGPYEPYPLWTLREEDLARHPYIGKRAAKGIIIFRDNTPKEDWTVGNIIKAGILDPGLDEKLARCRIAPPPSL